MWKLCPDSSLKSEGCWDHWVNIVTWIYHACLEASCRVVSAAWTPWIPFLGGGSLLEESPWFLFLSLPWLLMQSWMLKWLLLEESRLLYMFTFKRWIESFFQFWSALLFSCFVCCRHLCFYFIWFCYVAVTTLVFCFSIRKWWLSL